METKVLSANVPLPLTEKVDQLAERLERSPGWLVEHTRRPGTISRAGAAPDAWGRWRTCRLDRLWGRFGGRAPLREIAVFALLTPGYLKSKAFGDWVVPSAERYSSLEFP